MQDTTLAQTDASQAGSSAAPLAVGLTRSGFHQLAPQIQTSQNVYTVPSQFPYDSLVLKSIRVAGLAAPSSGVEAYVMKAGTAQQDLLHVETSAENTIAIDLGQGINLAAGDSIWVFAGGQTASVWWSGVIQ